MLTNGGAATCETDMTADVKKLVLVFDVGGSHVSAAICLENGFQLSSVASAPYPPEHTSDAFVDFLYALGTKASVGFEGVSGAELAIPGPFDFKNGVSLMRHKLPYIYGVDLRRLLAARFGWQPSQVRFLLDSAAFLLGEIAAGAAHGISRAVGITLGTGVGSAFAVDGRLVTEGPGVPPGGEIWNLPYEGGIIEDFVSTRAIQKNYQSRTGELAEVAKIAAKVPSDPEAAAVFAEFRPSFRTGSANGSPRVCPPSRGAGRWNLPFRASVFARNPGTIEESESPLATLRAQGRCSSGRRCGSVVQCLQ